MKKIRLFAQLLIHQNQIVAICLCFRHTWFVTMFGWTGVESLIFFERIETVAFVHYSDVIMGAMASQITSLTIVYSTVYSGGDQRKHQSSASLAFVRGSHRWPVNSPHKRPVTRKMFPFHDVIMYLLCAELFLWILGLVETELDNFSGKLLTHWTLENGHEF